MGWMGIRIKPSTVLVFRRTPAGSRHRHHASPAATLLAGTVAARRQHCGYGAPDTSTILGLSIIYTSLILIAGFSVFILSQFDGTKSLGYLTSMTLFLAMVTNLTLLPALLLWMDKVIEKKNKAIDFLLDEDDTDSAKLTD